jgi:iron complex transport system ATP-binding protein
MLEARELTVRYGQRTVVDGVSLSVTPGNLTTIIGPNGSGKSTLLQTLNGRLEPASGTVLLDNKPLTTFARRDVGRRIAVVAQEAELRFPITVFEFVLGGRYAWASSGAWGWETADDIQIVHAVLNETELTELNDRLMNELSGGERQRAVLARALATQAPILLLDEPTANLDLSHQARLLERVRARCDEHAAAALVVTHDVNLAAQFSDKVMLLNGGRTVNFGNPDQVLTPELLQQVFEVEVLVDAHPVTGVPRVTPVLERHRTE